MHKYFSQDGWLYRCLNRLWDLIILNFLFILTSIPIVTLGASTVALHTVLLKSVKNEEGYLVRDYWHAFKTNFKKATELFLIIIAFWSVLSINVFVTGPDNTILILLCGMFALPWLLVTLYALPLEASFENSVANTIINAFMVAVRYLPRTIQLIGIVLCVPLVLALLVLFTPSLLSWICSVFLFIGFSGIAWITAFVYRAVFDDLTESQEC